jgi:hypothetical protein
MSLHANYTHSFRRPALLALTTAVVALLLTASALAQPRGRRLPPLVDKRPAPPGIWQKNAVGGHLGPWFSDALGEDILAPGVRLSSNSTAFHLEFFYLPHLGGPLYLDVNFGAVGRGDIRITRQTGSYSESSFGDATLYPLGLGLQWLPFAKNRQLKFQPAFRLGGSLIIGTERLDTYIATDFADYVGVTAESRVGTGFYGGAGVFVLLAPQFALTGSVKYQHAKFSKELFGSRDYSGVQVLFGAAYLYP